MQLKRVFIISKFMFFCLEKNNLKTKFFFVFFYLHKNNKLLIYKLLFGFKKYTLAVLMVVVCLCFCSTWNILSVALFCLFSLQTGSAYCLRLKSHWHYDIFSVFVFWRRDQGAAVFIV